MINPIQAADGSIVLQEAGSGSRTTIGHDEFLTLLIAELEHQDPLAPMQSQEFAAQLAQFGSLERLYSIDTQLGESLNLDLLMTQAVNNTLAAGLIGREITASGESVILSNGSGTLRFELEADAQDVTIEILDQAGTVIRTISQKAMTEGEQEVVWDGKNNSGKHLTDGIYSYRVSAEDAEGNEVSVRIWVSGIITGVRYDSGSPILQVGDLEFPIGDVQSIRLPEG